MKSDSERTKNILFYSMLIVILLLCIYVIWKVNTGSAQCMSNPWSYGVNRIHSSDNQPVICSCSCSFLQPGKILFITKDNASIIDNIYKGGIK